MEYGSLEGLVVHKRLESLWRIVRRFHKRITKIGFLLRFG